MPEIVIDPGAYAESYYVLWRDKGRKIRRGPFRGRPYRIPSASTTATYTVDVGDLRPASALSFRLDRSSSIIVGLSKPTAAEVVAGNTLRLRTVPVQIDPGDFAGEYRPSFRIRGRSIAAVKGPLETHLVPDMTYRILIGRPSAASVDAWLQFRLDAKGRPRDKWMDPAQAATAKGQRIRFRTRLRRIRASFPANVGGYNVSGNVTRHLVRGVPVSITARARRTPSGEMAVSVGRPR